MFIYNVTINVEDSVHEEWLKWMKEVHIPEVLETGYFIENKICKVLNVEDTGKTYSIQYTCKTIEDYEDYQKNHAPRLQKAVLDKYKDKFVAFRTLLEIV